MWNYYLLLICWPHMISTQKLSFNHISRGKSERFHFVPNNANRQQHTCVSYYGGWTWFDQSCHLLERPTSSAQSLPVLGPTPGSISDWWFPKLRDWTLGGGRFAEDICKMASLSLHPYFSHSNFSSLMLPNPVLCHRGAYTPRHRGCCNTATRWWLTSWPCTRHLLWKGTANTKAQQLPENTSLLPVLCEATIQIEVKQL